jgi:hypothetical protein
MSSGDTFSIGFGSESTIGPGSSDGLGELSSGISSIGVVSFSTSNSLSGLLSD